MRFCNKFADIPNFVFWDKGDYLYLHMLLRKGLFTCILCQSMCVIINIEAITKYAGFFKKISREIFFSTAFV